MTKLLTTATSWGALAARAADGDAARSCERGMVEDSEFVTVELLSD